MRWMVPWVLGLLLPALAGCYMSTGAPGGTESDLDEAGRDSPGEPGQVLTPQPPGTSACSNDLPQVSGRAFQLCRTRADCPYPDSDLCYHAEGTEFGFCQFGDADIWCDGEGDVNVQPDPPLADWGPGMCAPHEWRDEMCCRFPGEWVCP